MVQTIIADGKAKNLFEIVVDLDKGIVASQQFLEGKHSYIDAEYMKQVEAACMADERVQREIKQLQLPDGATACVEPWAYATDGMNDMTERTTMVGIP